jgi:hypothetical protein
MEAQPQSTNDETISIDILGAGNEDQPASLENDSLGFHPYVEAVFSFLVNPATVAPFTLSIEGEWGAGKSSFMRQLQQTLKDKDFRTITFNAWREDKVESMWAAFALHFIKELTKELGHIERFKANARLRWKRFDLSKGWFSIVKTILLLILFLYLAITILSNFHAFGTVIKNDKVNFLAVLSNLGGAGVIIGILFFLGKVAEVTGNPFKADLQKFVNAPNYSGNVALIEEFHRDFKNTVDILTKDKEKIFIFIDDLDRAEIPKAAELMQGLNMMISDSPRLIFIIGMDREKVAAGVAAKYKELLPFLNPDNGVLNTPDSLRQARNFGYSFLEKFIQLSFQVPIASENFVKTFINSLSNSKTLQPQSIIPLELNIALY